MGRIEGARIPLGDLESDKDNAEGTRKRKSTEGSHTAARERLALPAGMTEKEEVRGKGLVLRGRLHDDGVGVFDVRIVNLIGVELQVAFQLQIHG